MLLTSRPGPQKLPTGEPHSLLPAIEGAPGLRGGQSHAWKDWAPEGLYEAESLPHHSAWGYEQEWKLSCLKPLSFQGLSVITGVADHNLSIISDCLLCFWGFNHRIWFHLFYLSSLMEFPLPCYTLHFSSSVQYQLNLNEKQNKKIKNILSSCFPIWFFSLTTFHLSLPPREFRYTNFGLVFSWPLTIYYDLPLSRRVTLGK